MSTTYSLVCDDCKETYWCGQGDYIYDIEKTTKFLHKHCGHRIRFINDLVDDESTEDYKDVMEDLCTTDILKEQNEQIQI